MNRRSCDPYRTAAMSRVRHSEGFLEVGRARILFGRFHVTLAEIAPRIGTCWARVSFHMHGKTCLQTLSSRVLTSPGSSADTRLEVEGNTCGVQLLPAAHIV